MISLNTVSLIGRLAEPPAPWDVADKPGATLYVLITQHVRGEDGWDEIDVRAQVEVPGKLGVLCVKTMTTDDRVAVSGRLTGPDAESPSSDGLWVIAQVVDFLDRRGMPSRPPIPAVAA